MKFKIAYVTATRAEYGIMKGLLEKINKSDVLELDLIVTGTHLEKKYGYTIDQIAQDGFDTTKIINMNIKNTDNSTISKSLSILTNEIGAIFNNNKYDLVLVLGDRYEMLPVATAALLYGYPICHIHGGETTLGNYDELIRHALTKLSYIHLTSTEEYRNRVISLGENPNNVLNIGSMGVENVLKTKMLSREDLSSILKIDFEKEFYLFLYHPITLDSKINQENEIDVVLEAVQSLNKQIIFIGGNADTGSDYFKNAIDIVVNKNNNFYQFSSLPTNYYHSLIKQSKGLIGNSSSGIIEVPSLGVPTLNIGDRQKGRLSAECVYHVEPIKSDIIDSIRRMSETEEYYNPYYKEDSSQLAYEFIVEKLVNGINLEKVFYEEK